MNLLTDKAYTRTYYICTAISWLLQAVWLLFIQSAVPVQHQLWLCLAVCIAPNAIAVAIRHRQLPPVTMLKLSALVILVSVLSAIGIWVILLLLLIAIFGLPQD